MKKRITLTRQEVSELVVRHVLDTDITNDIVIEYIDGDGNTSTLDFDTMIITEDNAWYD